MQENVEVYVDHLIACQNPICNEKSTVLCRTHKKQICSACAALFHYECSLNIKLELNFIKISRSICDGIIEEMVDLYKKYDDIRRDFPTYKDDLDSLLQNLKDCKEIIENPQPNMINAIEKVPNCIALMNKIQSSQAYYDYITFISKIKISLKTTNSDFNDEKHILRNLGAVVLMDIKRAEQDFREHTLRGVTNEGRKEVELIKQSMESTLEQYKEETKILLQNMKEEYEENYMTRQEITQINDELIKTIKNEVNALRKENSDLQENIRLKFEEQKDLNGKVAQSIQAIEKSQDLMTINIKDLDKDFKEENKLVAKLQNEIIAHQSSIDAMLDRLKKSEDNIAKAAQSQVDLESTFKVSKDDTANNLIQLKQETEDLIKDLKKIKDSQQLNINELYLKCSTLQHLAQFSNEDVDFLFKFLKDLEEGHNKTELENKLAKEYVHKRREEDTSERNLDLDFSKGYKSNDICLIEVLAQNNIRLPPLKSIEAYNLKYNPDPAFSFISKCFPDSVDKFEFDGYSIKVETEDSSGIKTSKDVFCLEDHEKLKTFQECFSKTKKQIYIRFCSDWSASTISKIMQSCAHIEEKLYFDNCDFGTEEDIKLDFENTPNIKRIKFYSCKLGDSVEESKILRAICDSTLTHSLEKIGFYRCGGIDGDKFKKYLEEQNIVFNKLKVSDKLKDDSSDSD